MSGIKGLARRLELSIGTVSRALNGRPDVSDETRQRVLKAAQEMGYSPNRSGRSLRQGKTNTVGFVMEVGNPASQGGDDFFMWLVDAMQEVLNAAGIDLILLPSRSADDPIEFLKRQVANGTVDALVITATRRQDARIAYLVEQRTPFLALGRSETPGDYPWIDLDFDGVARRAVAELVAAGHRRIAVAAPRREANLAHVYLRAYREALAERGLPHDPSLEFRVSASENGGVTAVRALMELAPRPTALLLVYEMMATGVYSELQRSGLTPGADLSVIGFRRNRQLRFLDPGLAGFDLDIPALGTRVGEAVLELLSGERTTSAGLIWPMTYVPAASVQLPPATVIKGGLGA